MRGGCPEKAGSVTTFEIDPRLAQISPRATTWAACRNVGPATSAGNAPRHPILIRSSPTLERQCFTRTITLIQEPLASSARFSCVPSRRRKTSSTISTQGARRRLQDSTCCGESGHCATVNSLGGLAKAFGTPRLSAAAPIEFTRLTLDPGLSTGSAEETLNEARALSIRIPEAFPLFRKLPVRAATIIHHPFSS